MCWKGESINYKYVTYLTNMVLIWLLQSLTWPKTIIHLHGSDNHGCWTAPSPKPFTPVRSEGFLKPELPVFARPNQNTAPVSFGGLKDPQNLWITASMDFGIRRIPETETTQIMQAYCALQKYVPLPSWQQYFHCFIHYWNSFWKTAHTQNYIILKVDNGKWTTDFLPIVKGHW